MKLFMSEYADINTKKLSLFEFRNYVNSCIVSLFFSRRDLIVTPNCKVDPEDVDSDEYKQYVYKTTVKKQKNGLKLKVLVLLNLKKYLVKICCKRLTTQRFYII